MKTEVTLIKKLDGKTTIKAFAKLQKLGDQRPYFSLTGEETEYGRIQCCGCMHDELLDHWPELKPLVDIHLSDAETGEPMHALENGWYWAGGYGSYKGERNDPPNATHLASHLRITPEYAQEIIDRVKAGTMDKQEFSQIVSACETVWHTEACIARNLINKLAEAA